ncbi:hypothetical protein SDC9_46704 [bioreactor metagenome]|uniref:Uncharacterized protein n=1 Tax=bioreactor metagenome TaxID=1076179 RepID=A0A644WAD3_9ZZZZ
MPADPILEAVAGMVTEDTPEWQDSATELMPRQCDAYSALDIQPNALTRRLNVYGDRLKAEYGFAYRNVRKGNLPYHSPVGYVR